MYDFELFREIVDLDYALLQMTLNQLLFLFSVMDLELDPLSDLSFVHYFGGFEHLSVVELFSVDPKFAGQFLVLFLHLRDFSEVSLDI